MHFYSYRAKQNHDGLQYDLMMHEILCQFFNITQHETCTVNTRNSNNSRRVAYEYAHNLKEQLRYQEKFANLQHKRVPRSNRQSKLSSTRTIFPQGTRRGVDEVVSMESALTTSWVVGLGVRMPRRHRSFEAISSMNTTLVIVLSCHLRYN